MGSVTFVVFAVVNDRLRPDVLAPPAVDVFLLLLLLDGAAAVAIVPFRTMDLEAGAGGGSLSSSSVLRRFVFGSVTSLQDDEDASISLRFPETACRIRRDTKEDVPVEDGGGGGTGGGVVAAGAGGRAVGG